MDSNGKRFPNTLNIYRGKAAVRISPGRERQAVFISIAPAKEGMENKVPAAGQKKYDWEKKLTASFNYDETLNVAYAAGRILRHLEALAPEPDPNSLKWYRDPAKAGRKGNPKTFGFFRMRESSPKPRYVMGGADNVTKVKFGVILEESDLYKIEFLLREAAAALIGWRQDIEEEHPGNHGEQPLTRTPAKNGLKPIRDVQPLEKPPAKLPDETDESAYF